jgi:hypothetical protein
MYRNPKLLPAFVPPFSAPPVIVHAPESAIHGESGPGSLPREKSSVNSWAWAAAR